MCLLGLYYLATTTYFESLSSFGNGWYFLKRQVLWISLAIILYLILKKVKLHFWYKYSSVLYIFSTISLIAVLIPGIGHRAYGAQRWINIAGLTIQPVEFYKLASILYFSKLFSIHKNIGLRQLGLALGLPLSFIFFQPNLSSTCLCAGVILALYYLSNQNLKKLILALALLIPLVFIVILTSTYRRDRLLSMFQNNSYHSQQMQKAVSAGGLFGVGLGNSQQKYKFIPQLAKDSIAAIISEELGLLGLFIICLSYLVLTLNIIRISTQSLEPFRTYVAYGLCLWILLQTFVNLSSVVGLIPLTGVPLPFISYGGSSLIVLFLPLAILGL